MATWNAPDLTSPKKSLKDTFQHKYPWSLVKPLLGWVKIGEKWEKYVVSLYGTGGGGWWWCVYYLESQSLAARAGSNFIRWKPLSEAFSFSQKVSHLFNKEERRKVYSRALGSPPPFMYRRGEITDQSLFAGRKYRPHPAGNGKMPGGVVPRPKTPPYSLSLFIHHARALSSWLLQEFVCFKEWMTMIYLITFHGERQDDEMK